MPNSSGADARLELVSVDVRIRFADLYERIALGESAGYCGALETRFLFQSRRIVASISG
jgi:hypothetical protein